MNEHGSVVELGARVVEKSIIDALSDVLQLLHSRLPVCGENLGCQFAPC